jgi:hypothetical protein
MITMEDQAMLQDFFRAVGVLAALLLLAFDLISKIL